MARQNSRTQRAQAGAKTWDAPRRRADVSIPDGDGRLHETISAWAVAEVAPGRLMPWLPVAFGLGIAVYFTADRVDGFCFGLRCDGGSCPDAPACHCISSCTWARCNGPRLAVSTLHTARIAHQILQRPVSSTVLAGFVEIREEGERSDRIVLRVQRFEAAGVVAAPERVRVAVRKGSAPAVGIFVELKAHLSPPLQPLRPGGYDFACDMYFQRIGASGYALGAIKMKAPPIERGFWLSYASVIDDLRESMDKRIRAAIPGDSGSIASALITGKRDAISTPVNDAMYVSSLAHVLSISGYHMAVVAGIMFFFIRAVLALIPSLASRHPIKKWAAFGALIASAFYLLLSGTEVATQRSFIMIAIVLIGVMLDRPTLPFRTLAVAAIVVLSLAPQAIVHPSFQMSFAATLALVAAYQNGMPWQSGRDSSRGRRVAL